MFIQGNLQNVFDALYELGVIDPLLKADWKPLHSALEKNPRRVAQAVTIINQKNKKTSDLLESLKDFDQETLMFVAMEVARELIEFEDRSVLH